MEQNQPHDNEVQVGKVYAILAYLSILVLVPIFGARDNRFARFHANQGLVLLVLNVAVSFLSRISFLSIITGVLGLICLVFMILGMVNAAKGQYKPLPVIGGITLLPQ